MKKKLFTKVLCTALISSMVFASIDLNSMAAMESESYFLYEKSEEQEDIAEDYFALEELSDNLVYEVTEDSVDVDAEAIVEEKNEMQEEKIVFADADIAGGTLTSVCADGSEGSVTWRIDASGALTVNGEGDCGELVEEVYVWPWTDYDSKITSATVTLSNFEHAENMFLNCIYMKELHIENLDTTYVTNMSNMFADCEKLDADVSKLNTENVTNMSSMFRNCFSWKTLDVSKFNTAKVESMAGMFKDCAAVNTLDVSKFQTAKVKDMGFMFWDCMSVEELDVSGFDTSNVTSMAGMFGFCEELKELELSNFNTSKVTTMESMFDDVSVRKLDLSSFDTSNVVSIYRMFGTYAHIEEIDMSSFDLAKLEKLKNEDGEEIENYTIFDDADHLIQLKTPKNLKFDIAMPLESAEDYWGDEDGAFFTMLPKEKDSSITLTRKGIDGGKISTVRADNSAGTITWNLDRNYKLTVNGSGATTQIDESGFLIWPWQKYNEEITTAVVVLDDVKNLNSFFWDCDKLEEVNLERLDTTETGNFTYMFYSCNNLKSIDVSNFKTSNAFVMEYMFGDCESLEELDLSSFDTSKTKSMWGMFKSCTKLRKVNLSSFNTSSVETMEDMFGGCASLEELDLSKFDTSKVRDFSGMFSGCKSLKNLSAEQFDFSAVGVEYNENTGSLTGMFGGCESLESIATDNWKVSEATNYFAFLRNCTSLKEIDLSGFDFSKVTNANAMFEGASSLTKIKTPTNVAIDIELPKVSGNETWLGEADGVKYAVLPKKSDKSISLNKINNVSVNSISISYNGKAVSANELKLNIGNSLTLSANILPADATVKTVVWNSSNKSVATVSSNGQITAVASGNTIISVATKDGTKSASCNLVVVSGNGTDSASENNTPGGNTPSGDIPGGNDEKPVSYTVSVTYGENGLVSANRTSTVSDDNVSEITMKNKLSSYEVTLVSGNDVVFSIVPETEFGISQIQLKQNGVSLNAIGTKSEDGKIEISEIDKDGKVTVTIKSLSANTTLSAEFVRTTYNVTLAIEGMDDIAIKLVDDKLYDAKTGAVLDKLPTPEKKGEVFAGWYTEDGTLVTLENIVSIAMSGKMVKAIWNYVNVVVKQKVDITNLLSVSANDTASIKKYVVYCNGVKTSKFASVSSKGVLTAKKVDKDGKPIELKVVALDKTGKELGDCFVTITATKADADKLIKANVAMNQIGATYDMNDVLMDLPKNSYDSIIWSVPASSKVATIDAKTGVLTALEKSGKVKVTAEFINTNGNRLTGKTSAKVTMTVTVKLPKQSSKKATITAPKTKTLKLTNLTNQKVTWSVSEEGIVSLDNVNGTDMGKGVNAVVVSGVKSGTVTVTAIVNGDTKHPYAYTVTVK